MAIRCPRLTIDNPLLTADTWNPEVEAAGATLHLMGIDTAAIQALPWQHRPPSVRIRRCAHQLLPGGRVDLPGPATLRLCTRGERHYATRQESADTAELRLDCEGVTVTTDAVTVRGIEMRDIEKMVWTADYLSFEQDGQQYWIKLARPAVKTPLHARFPRR